MTPSHSAAEKKRYSSSTSSGRSCSGSRLYAGVSTKFAIRLRSLSDMCSVIDTILVSRTLCNLSPKPPSRRTGSGSPNGSLTACDRQPNDGRTRAFYVGSVDVERFQGASGARGAGANRPLSARRSELSRAGAEVGRAAAEAVNSQSRGNSVSGVRSGSASPVRARSSG